MGCLRLPGGGGRDHKKNREKGLGSKATKMSGEGQWFEKRKKAINLPLPSGQLADRLGNVCCCASAPYCTSGAAKASAMKGEIKYNSDKPQRVERKSAY